MLRWWTISRATGAGFVAGLLSLLLWPAYASFGEPLLWPFVATLAVTAFCGLSILWITGTDMVRRDQRNRRLRVVRSFDVAVALLFVGPSLLMLEDLLG